MKKHLLFAMVGATALTLASCSADDPIAENTTQGAIRYTVVTDNQSRAVASYDNVAKPKKFYMSAIWTTDNRGEDWESENYLYFYRDEISGDGNGTWTDVTGERYWPAEGTLSFYAVADGTTDGPSINIYDDETDSVILFGYDNLNTASISYEVNKDVAQQGDLIYAVQPNVSKPDDGMVSVNFHHALSQVGFVVKNENPNIHIVVNSIKVNGVKARGIYTLPNETTDKAENRGTWSYVDDYWTQRGNDNSTNITETFTYSNELWGEGTINFANDFKRIMALFPEANEDFYFTLNLTIEGRDALGYSVDIDMNEKDFDVPVAINWEEGNRYIYTFIFGKNWKADGSTPIGYTWTVDDWADGNEANPDDCFDFIEGQPMVKQVGEHTAVMMRPYIDEETPALYFATCNIGAETSGDSGLYFWWGDVSGSENGANISEVLTQNKSIEELADYLTSTDGSGVLNSEKDAAAVQWGNGWRMPTKEELDWLKSECTWTWQAATDSSLAGYKVTSAYTGKEIFLPVSGSNWVGCWSSTPASVTTTASYGLSAWFNNIQIAVAAQQRTYMMPIRPVVE